VLQAAVEAACYTSMLAGWRKWYSVDRSTRIAAREWLEHSVGAAPEVTLAIVAVATMVCSIMALAAGPEMEAGGERASSGHPATACSLNEAASQAASKAASQAASQAASPSGAKAVHAAEARE
jgi:hypothetical protein